MSAATPIHAALTTCQGDGQFGHIKAISWDTETLAAEVTDATGKVFAGKLTLSRPHNEGTKVNILVTHPKPLYGADATEYIVFPLQDRFRVLSVQYIIRDGQRFADALGLATEADCTTR